MKKKLLPLLLVGFLSFSLVPVNAFAAEEEEITQIEVIEEEIVEQSEPEEKEEIISESESEPAPLLEGITENVEAEANDIEYDAHCFVRYDSTNQKEDGTTHYSYKNYFPIGEYTSTNKSDVSSPDAKVTFKENESVDAHVGDSENVITDGNVNLYKKENGEPLFQGVTDSTTLEEYFAPVYSRIVDGTMASSETIQNSITTWLKDEKYGNAYQNGKMKVLWYVIKTEPDAYHIDGVLYWVTTGDVVDTNDDPDNPIYNPIISDPEPTIDPENPTPIITPDTDTDTEPTVPDPIITPKPDPVPEPVIPSTDLETEPTVTPVDQKPQEDKPIVIPKKDETKPGVKIEVKNEKQTEELETNIQTVSSPKTGDNSHVSIWFGIMVISLIIVFFCIYKIKKEKE